MTKFTLFDNCIIVIDNDDHVLEIFNMNTKKCHNKIGSNGNKILKNYVITCYKSYYKSFESWNDLLKHYNITDNNINITGIYQSYHRNKNIYKKFFHTNFSKEGQYIEYYDNKKEKIIANYVNDKLFGEYKEYDINGNLEISANYIDDKLHGKYFETKWYYGYLTNWNRIYSHYDNGNLDGYYSSDSIEKYEYYTYVDNKKHGMFFICLKRFLYDGRRRIYGEYDNDKLLFANVYLDDSCELQLKKKIYLDKNNLYNIETFIYENNSSYKIIDKKIEKEIKEITINNFI
jgi:antitoxin component YwqK of YwqJK toxin-antitoxin module